MNEFLKCGEALCLLGILRLGVPFIFIFLLVLWDYHKNSKNKEE